MKPDDTPPAGALRFVVEGEARRAFAESTVAPDPRRAAEGWERRFVTDASRVDEIVRLYRELGWETAVDPVRPDQLSDACSECRLAAALRLSVVYTRHPGARPSPAALAGGGGG